MTAAPDLPAGEFSAWLGAMRAALRHGRDAGVPCGDCCACCDTAHFVHIGPDESDTLAHVPRELLFAAPGQPAGTMLLGYDAHGHCPLLEGGLCSIYEHRPLTCRVYDCRVFAAAGIDADRDEITRRARRWAFTYATRSERDDHRAVRAAARFLGDHAALLPPEAVPHDPPHRAVLAVLASGAFTAQADQAGRDCGPSAAEQTAVGGELADEQLARRMADVARRLMPGGGPPDTC